MSFYKVNTEEAAKSNQGSGYISRSGIYDGILHAVIVDENEKGARSLHFFVEVNEQDQVLYNMIRLDNNDGTRNFQANLFDKLCVIADLEEISAPEEATLPIGKNGADKDVMILTDFEELPIKFRIQNEYSRVPDGYAKAGEIQEKQILKAIFREDGASADEILEDKEVGGRLEKEEKYADNVTYKNELDEDTIKKWLDNGRKEEGSSAASTSGKPKSKPKFGRKS